MKSLAKSITTIILALTVTLAPFCEAKTEPPARPVTTESVTQSLAFINTLIGKSSLAKNIEKTQFPPAVAYLNEARRLHGEAVSSLTGGDLNAAIKHRDEAIRLAFEAGHLTQMASGNNGKQHTDYQSKVRSINALLRAYKKIATDKGAQGDGATLQQETEAFLDQAENYASGKDYTSASHTLALAYNQLKTAIEKVRGGETLGELSTAQANFEDRHTDYKVKLRSIQALLDAHQRIANEKADKEQASRLNATVKPLLDEAAAHAAKGEDEQSLAALNYAYSLVTASIEKMRGGETLVRTLKFETAEEEYHYELDRNDTYKMLIKMLVEDQKTMKLTQRIKTYLDKADALRTEAEKSAHNGNFQEAVQQMENSTKNLVFAMRNAGFFIPG